MYEIKRHHSATMQFLGLILMATAASISGCSSQTETTEVPVTPNPVVVEEPEPMSMAFASVSNTRADTRLTNDVVQMNDATSYREITDFYFIALEKEESSISSVSNSLVRYGNSEDHLPIRYYHFSFCDMQRNTNGCLVYAKAEDKSVDLNEDSEKSDFEKKIYNGCLAESPYISNNVNSTDQITFEPVSIYGDAAVGDDGIPADAWTLANALTDIANIENWSTMNDVNLKPLLAHFTNYGYDLAGSAASVRAWIGAVKKAAEDMGSLGDGQVDELVRLDIISKASDYLNPEKEGNIAGLNYPQNINLPDGSAVLRWSEVEGVGGTKVKKFVPQLRTTTLDDINSVSYFVYPASLYYFVNSDIWTSNSKVTFDQYKGKSKWKGDSDTDADAVQTLFKAGGTITGSTKTVAIADPLQYAVARLQLTVEVKNDVDALTYNGTNTIPYKVGNDYQFRLTGVIVGGQRKVGYDFKPIALSEDDERFVYDSQVGDTYYLKKKSEYTCGTVDPVNTLVLQTCDNEDVNVILEFEYTPATADYKEFKCLDGYVYPNTRFYLVGELKATDFKPGTGDATSQGRIFTQDYTTTIEMTVKSLEKAYNVLPNIIAKNLEIGVMTTPKWKAATPQEAVIME